MCVPQKLASKIRPPRTASTWPTAISSGGPRERVSAGLAARRRDEAALAQHPHHLRDVRLGDALRAGELGNRDASVGPVASDAEQAPKPVLFLSGELHRRPPGSISVPDRFAVTSSPAAASRRPTSCSCSTAGRRAPGPPRRRFRERASSLLLMSSFSTSPIPQPGAVSVKRTSALLPPSGPRRDLALVDEAEVHDVDGDLRVVAGAELVPRELVRRLSGRGLGVERTRSPRRSRRRPCRRRAPCSRTGVRTV